MDFSLLIILGLPYLLRFTLSDNIRHVQDPVIIEPNYFSNPHDVAVLVRAIKDSLLIGQSSHFKQFGAQFYDKPLDQCSQVLQLCLRQNVASLYVT
jgi:hypothetical protein